MDFQTLTEDQFSALTEDQFATFLESGGTSTTTCLYDSSAIAAIKSAVDALSTAIANLQSDITAIKARMPQTGTVSTLTADEVWIYNDIYVQIAGSLGILDTVHTIKSKTDNLPADPAAKSDVQITVNADGINVPTATENASAVWSAATRTLTSTTGGGGATAQEVWEYADRTLTSSIPTVSEIQAGLAKTTDLPTVPTVAEIQSGLAKTTDIPTISNLETVAAAIKAKTDNLPADPAAKSDVQITVNADGIDVPTVSEIWNHTTRTLTSQIPTVSDIQSGLATATSVATLQTTANAIKTQTDKIPSTSITPSDLTALRTHGDTNWATATGFATPADVTLTTTTETVNVTTQTVDVSGLATAASVAALQTSVNAIPTMVYTVPTASENARAVHDILPTDYARDSAVFEVKTMLDDVAGNALTASDLQGLTVDLSGVAKTSEVTSARNDIISRMEDVQANVDTQAVAEAVWGANTRTLTTSQNTLTAQEVWEYGSRTLTGSGTTLPDDVGAEVYCTRQDVERRWGMNNVTQWADMDNDGDEAKIAAQVDWAILTATGKVNADLQSSVYVLPFSPVPQEVRYHAAALAGVELFNCRAMAATNDSPTIQRAETEYQAWLTAVLSGVEIAGAERIA